jgi:hypothetical protein
LEFLILDQKKNREPSPVLFPVLFSPVLSEDRPLICF